MPEVATDRGDARSYELGTGAELRAGGFWGVSRQPGR